MMKLLTFVGTRLRIEPYTESAITKTFTNKNVELIIEKQEDKDDGTWYFVSSAEDNRKGWVRFDFVLKKRTEP